MEGHAKAEHEAATRPVNLQDLNQQDIISNQPSVPHAAFDSVSDKQPENDEDLNQQDVISKEAVVPEQIVSDGQSIDHKNFSPQDMMDQAPIHETTIDRKGDTQPAKYEDLHQHHILPDPPSISQFTVDNGDGKQPAMPADPNQQGSVSEHSTVHQSTVDSTTGKGREKYEDHFEPSDQYPEHQIAIDPVDGSQQVNHEEFNQADTVSDQSSVHQIAIDDEWDPWDNISDASSFLSNISSSVTNYQWENGRRYHAYQEGRYPLPNDESELDREDMKHHEWMLITDFRLHLAPIPERPEKILDIGTGTGIWAIQMAEKYPQAEVIGIDLSPIQPKWVPPNLAFEVDDVEAPWLHQPDSCDLIHVRFMFLAVRDFPKLLRQAYAALKPGGHIELSELDIHPSSYDSQFPPNSQILLWINELQEAATRMGVSMWIARSFKSMLIDAGFVDVTEKILEVPWGGWPKDPRLKTIGTWHMEQLKLGLQGIAMGLFTRVLGWTPAEVEVFLVGLRKELNNKSLHIIDHAYCVHGRKP